MLIEIEETPNQNIRNFYLSIPVLSLYQAEYAKMSDTNHSPLFNNIFKIGGIQELLLLPNVLFVQKKADATWSFLEPQIMAELVDYNFNDFKKFDFSKQDILSQIEALTESQIRPYLQKDGGDIEIISFKEGVLSVRLNGKCKGCPYASNTLKNKIEATFKKYIKDVEIVQKED